MTTTSEALSSDTVAAGCSAKPMHLPRPKPISVNGVTISRSDIARETQNHPAAKPIDAWLAAARALVVRELLLQEARRLRITPEPASDGEGRSETEEEAIVRQLVEQEIKVPEADEASCRRVYEAQPARFRSSDLYAVRHILLAAAPGDRAARKDAFAKAEAIIAQLTTAADRFAAMASEHSACPSRTQAGHLGQICRGQTVPEFEAHLASAPIGRVNPRPVETRYGFHVVLVEQRLEGRQLPFDAVRSQIAAWLADRVRHIAIRQYISLLAERAAIVGIELEQKPASTA